MDITTEECYDGNGTTAPERQGDVSLTHEAYMSLGIYLLVTGILGSAGNSVVVAMFLTDKRLRSSVDVLLLNLALADLAMCACCFPFVSASSFAQRWLFGEWGCVAYGYMGFLLGNASIFTLTVISVQRYLVVCKRHSNDRGKGTTVTLAVIWTQAVVWSSLPLLLPHSYAREPFLTSCTLAWASPVRSTRIFLYSAVGWTVLLFLILTVCYLGIYLTTRRDLITTSSRAHSDLLVSKICFLLVVAYVVCWGPYTFFSLWYPHHPHHMPPVFTTLPVVLAKMSSCINPLLYILVSQRFRQRYLAVLCCRRVVTSVDQVQPHSPEPTQSLKTSPSSFISEV